MESICLGRKCAQMGTVATHARTKNSALDLVGLLKVNTKAAVARVPVIFIPPPNPSD